MQLPKDISEYLRVWAPEFGERILDLSAAAWFRRRSLPAHGSTPQEPFPAQMLATMGVVKRWNEARRAAVIAECGTGDCGRGY